MDGPVAGTNEVNIGVLADKITEPEDTGTNGADNEIVTGAAELEVAGTGQLTIQ